MIKTKTMDKELKKKIESSKASVSSKKPKGCASCKKKKEVIEKLPEVEDIEVFYIPTPDEIRLAYVELGNRVDDKRAFINKVYKNLFDEDFNFGCSSCVNAQARRLRNYIIEVLKMEV